MAENRIAAWVSLLPANGPRLVSAVLGVLIAVELGRIGVALFGPKPVTPIAPATAASTAAGPGVNIQSLIDGHLFGVAKIDASQNADPADAPQSTASFVLAGTIATSDPRQGVAIIGDGGATRVYSVGQTIGGYTLHSVYLDRVLLDRGGGALEALLLPKLPPLVGVAQRAAYNGNGGDRQAAIVDNLRNMVAHDPDMLKEIIRTLPTFDAKAHKLKGFRVYPGRSAESFAKLGLSPGDLIVAVNGSPVDDLSRSQELLNVIQGSSTATLTIEHLGRRKDVTLNVAQVAEQATKELSNEPIDSASPGDNEPPANPPDDSNN
jgi:general secretion pathway protein C